MPFIQRVTSRDNAANRGSAVCNAEGQQWAQPLHRQRGHVVVGDQGLGAPSVLIVTPVTRCPSQPMPATSQPPRAPPPVRAGAPAAA